MPSPIQPQDLTDRLIDRVRHELTFAQATERVLQDALELLEKEADGDA